MAAVNQDCVCMALHEGPCQDPRVKAAAVAPGMDLTVDEILRLMDHAKEMGVRSFTGRGLTFTFEPKERLAGGARPDPQRAARERIVSEG